MSNPLRNTFTMANLKEGGVALLLSIPQFWVAIAVAVALNELHRAMFPPPRTSEELEQDRKMYWLHLILMVPLLCLGYVYTVRLVQLPAKIYGRHLRAGTDLLGPIAVILAFAWASTMPAMKTQMLVQANR